MRLGAIKGDVPSQALHNKMSHFLSFEAQRLTQPTRAISRNEKGDTMEFRITAGLDQGDPFSPVAFAATLPLGTLQNAILQAQRVAGIGRPVTGCFSFLDDFTLAVPHEAQKPQDSSRGKGSSRAETEHDQVHDPHSITSGGLVGTNKTTRQPHHSWKTVQHCGGKPGNKL